jgi:glycosyltransferase involved in cell wall biosynthesis
MYTTGGYQPMPKKIKLSEAAKNLNVTSQELIDYFAQQGDTKKKNGSSINEDEMNLLLEHYSKLNEVESFEAYFASASQPKPEAEEKSKAKKTAAKKKTEDSEKEVLELKKYGILVIGCGHIGTQHLENIYYRDNIQIVAVVDSSEENAKYYAKSRIFVSIPQSDSMPTSLLEAMSAGCIPVISDLPSYRGLVEHGRNALVVSDKEIRSGDYLHKAFELDTEVLMRNNKVFTDEFATIESNKQRLWDLVDKISL